MTLIVIAVVALLAIYVVISYNALIRRRNQVDNAWSQVDVQLKRRLDLVPNLVETVKGYAAHERPVMPLWLRVPVQKHKGRLTTC